MHISLPKAASVIESVSSVSLLLPTGEFFGKQQVGIADDVNSKLLSLHKMMQRERDCVSTDG